MQYNTWHTLNSILNEEIKRCHNEYCIAVCLVSECKFDPTDDKPPTVVNMSAHGKAIIEQIYTNYRHWTTYYENMKTQLRYAFEQGCNPKAKKGKFTIHESV